MRGIGGEAAARAAAWRRRGLLELLELMFRPASSRHRPSASAKIDTETRGSFIVSKSVLEPWLDTLDTFSTHTRHTLDTVDTVDTGVNRHPLDTPSTLPTLVSTSVDSRDALMLSTVSTVSEPSTLRHPRHHRHPRHPDTARHRKSHQTHCRV